MKLIQPKRKEKNYPGVVKLNTHRKHKIKMLMDSLNSTLVNNIDAAILLKMTSLIGSPEILLQRWPESFNLTINIRIGLE